MMTIDDVRALTPWQLADHADCGSPDSAESPGAEMLSRVARDVADLAQSWRDANPCAPWSDLLDAVEIDTTEVADTAPSVYTHTRWQEFTDLAAWQEDASELGASADDLTAAAGVALYMIAERLAQALLSELSEQEDAADDLAGFLYDSAHQSQADARTRAEHLSTLGKEAVLQYSDTAHLWEVYVADEAAATV